ncbi:MAG: F-box protein, partial [bacterium]|nr:F-box protein [bacterium]
MKKQLMTLLISILVFEPAFCMESATDMSSENSGVALENSGFKTVPPEIIQKIFAHLPYSDLSKAARVCKEFNNNARDPIF